MPRIAQRPDRISLRISAQAKRTLERAAAYADKSLTDFITEVAMQRADAIVRDQEVISLSAQEWQRFQSLLLDPPSPNDKLTHALAEHSRIVRR